MNIDNKCYDYTPEQANHANRRFYAQWEGALNDMDPELFEFLQKEAQPELEPPPIRLCRRTVELKGPHSPLETMVNAMIEEAKALPASIDRQSVNSVLLNNEPQEHAKKYMVAASVTRRSDDSDELVLRYTTLMPDIRGCGALMALIFCPTMEIRRDKHKNRYTSIITGLGYHENQTYLREHNMKIDLDVEIDLEDMDTVSDIDKMPTTIFSLLTLDIILSTDQFDQIQYGLVAVHAKRTKEAECLLRSNQN